MTAHYPGLRTDVIPDVVGSRTVFVARWFADKAALTQRQGQAYIQLSESPRSSEESLYLGTRAAVEGSPSVRQHAAHL